jgi:hypothetical protein
MSARNPPFAELTSAAEVISSNGVPQFLNLLSSPYGVDGFAGDVANVMLDIVATHPHSALGVEIQ